MAAATLTVLKDMILKQTSGAVMLRQLVRAEQALVWPYLTGRFIQM